MHILLLIDCYLPSRKSGAKQIHDLGAELRRCGHDITILTTAHQLKRNLEVTVEDGLRIARVKTGKTKGASRFRRAFQEARLSAVVWRRAANFLVDSPADLIVFYSPTIFWGDLVRRLKRLWRIPAYLILRDIFPEWAVDIGVLKRGLIYSYFRKHAIGQYEAADVVAVQSPSDLKYFERSFEDRPYRLEVLHNWSTLHERNIRGSRYRQRLGLQNKVVFFYGGNLGVAQDIDNIVRLASSLLEYDDIFFLLIGDGTEEPRLRKLIADTGIKNTLLLPAVAQLEYLAMVSEFDVGLITLDRRLTNHNIPGKLLPYCYWGIPVLASVNPGSDLFEVIAKGHAGLCIENGADQKLRQAALTLAGNADLRIRMGRNARLLLERTFSVENAARQILHSFGELAGPQQRRNVGTVIHKNS